MTVEWAPDSRDAKLRSAIRRLMEAVQKDAVVVTVYRQDVELLLAARATT